MATTTFSDRIKKAADDLPGGTSTAWVQYLAQDHTVSVRMQAPEIMKQFRGNVKFGTGVKGILFFKKKADLDVVGNIKFRNAKYPVSATVVVVETEFAAPGPGFEALARFVGKVDTKLYAIPDFNSSVLGTGQFSPYQVISWHAGAVRVPDKPTVLVGSGFIRVQLSFTSQHNTPLNWSGFFVLQGLAPLRRVADGLKYCVANYSPDRIVFHIENEENSVVALFLPNEPMSTIGPMSGPPPRVDWEGLRELVALAPDD